jgi:hypothetical protein
VTTPCTYTQIGELNGNLAGLLATEQGITTPFKVHSDSAPTVYITGNPARTDPVARAFERGTGALTAANPMTAKTDKITQFLADPVEMKLLHMVTADPARTPTFTLFADANYFLFAGAPNCTAACVTQQPGFAWNHGDTNHDITTTWLGMAGPGVAKRGVDNATWSDHTDVRPTTLALVGLRDDYSHDGRVLTEELTGAAIPRAVKQSPDFVRLARVYKQIDAAVGQLGFATLKISTRALMSGSSTDDSTYVKLENRLKAFNTTRDAIAGQMVALLEGAEFHSHSFSNTQAIHLINEGQTLLDQVTDLAGRP